MFSLLRFKLAMLTLLPRLILDLDDPVGVPEVASRLTVVPSIFWLFGIQLI